MYLCNILFICKQYTLLMYAIYFMYLYRPSAPNSIAITPAILAVEAHPSIKLQAAY